MPPSTEPTTNPGQRPASCDAALDGLEAYLDSLDGSAGLEEGLPAEPPDRLASVAAHLERCPACARELALAMRIRRELRAFPEPGLPRSRRPWPETGRPGPRPPKPAWRRPGLLAILGGFAAAAGVALVAWTGLLTPATVSTPPQPDFPTAAEVARAEVEARYALARIAEVSDKTGLELRDDIFARRVVAPTTAALARSLNLRGDPSPHRKPAP